MLHSHLRTTLLIAFGALAFVSMSAAFVLMNAMFAGMTAALVPANAAFAAGMEIRTAVRPKPSGACADSQRASRVQPGPEGCNRKALYAMVADRAFPVLRVGSFELWGKGIRWGLRYEGHEEREAGRKKGEGKGVPANAATPSRQQRALGPRFDPASAPLGAGASRRIERGSACGATFFRHE